MSKPVFKQNNQGEILLFPPRLDQNISAHHLVRVINRIVDKMDISDLLASYKGGGTSSYHPRMLLKVLLYAYCMKIYTGRKIANALTCDITFMWLSGNQTPGFRTINEFRSGRLKEGIGGVFKSLLVFMFEEGYIRLEEYYCDGTIFQADANKHKVVWKKNLVRHREAVEARIDETLKEIDTLNQEEDALYGDEDLPIKGKADESQESRLDAAAESLNKLISSTKKEVSRKARSLESKLEIDKVRTEVYAEKEAQCGTRSGYSKTDPDASPIRTKEYQDDLRPGYNGLIGSENQHITGVSVHQNPNDGTCFKKHFNEVLELLPKKVDTVIADAIFGTEENYEYLEKEVKVAGLLKYPSYEKERGKSFRENPFLKENMLYSPSSDAYVCPNGQWLLCKGRMEEINKNGFVSIFKSYVCENCLGCSFSDKCRINSQDSSKRTMRVNLNLERHKEHIRQELKTEQGRRMILQRTHDVETCFGDIKKNQLFRRTHLRGLQKVKTEFTVVAIAHNLRKMHLAILKKAE